MLKVFFETEGKIDYEKMNEIVKNKYGNDLNFLMGIRNKEDYESSGWVKYTDNTTQLLIEEI